MRTISVVDRDHEKRDDSGQPSTLVIGLGNPILGDDAVGWRVAEQVHQRLSIINSSRPGNHIEVDTLAVGGLALMERMVGYKVAVIIDAINTGNMPGTVCCQSLKEFPEHATGHLSSAHDTTLQNALRVGEEMGATLPDTIYIIGIETQTNYDFTEELTPKIEQSIPVAVQTVMELIS